MKSISTIMSFSIIEKKTTRNYSLGRTTVVVVVALETTSIHLNRQWLSSSINSNALPIKCILTFSTKEINMIFKL